MTTQAQRQRTVTERLAKKPKISAALDGNSIVLTTVDIVFAGKSTLISHNDLRSRTLRNHLGKQYRPSAPRKSSIAHQKHGVELTDDVIIRDRNGRRIPTPAYATLRIDQLPQFQKG